MRTTSSATSHARSATSLAAYTLLQLFEVAVASLVLLAGVVKGWGPVALLGGGFLMGKAILNVLWPEGGTVYRRSLIGYGVAGVFVLGGLTLEHFVH
jgi:hypothetical protein